MELLLQWIDSLGIEAPEHGVEDTFSNGFMFGKLLHSTNQLTEAGWQQFVNDDKSDSKIRNYCLLFPKMRQLGIKFDAQVAKAVMRRTPGVAPRVLYELQSAIRPLAAARVGRSTASQQRLLRPAARSHKPGYEAKQAAIFERNLRVMAENQNDVLLQAHMAKQASNVSSLQAAREEAHATRLQAHRHRLADKRAERLHMLRTRHMVTHAREEAGIREWQRNQEIRLAQTLAKRAFQEKTAARRVQRQDTLRYSARAEAHEGIAEFEALAAEQGVAAGAPPGMQEGLGSTIAAQQAALQEVTDGPREDSSDPMERRDALHMRLTRKLASTKETPLAAQPAAGKASGMQHALLQCAHRRRAFVMHSRDSRLQLHASQRHEQVTSLLAWRCEAELELDDVVARILKHEVIFRENRAARSQQVQEQREQDAHLEAERQRMAVQQHREQFATDIANACGDMESAAAARQAVLHRRAVEVARSAVLKVVDAAVAIAEARELAGMRLVQTGALAHVCSTMLPQLTVSHPTHAAEGKGGEPAAEGGEGKEGDVGSQQSSAEVLLLPEGGVDAVSWLQAHVAYTSNSAVGVMMDAVAPLPIISLAAVVPAAGSASEADDSKKPKKGKKGDAAEGDAHNTAAAAAVQAQALQHIQAQLLGVPPSSVEDSKLEDAAEAHARDEMEESPCGVQLPRGACVALMGTQGDEQYAPSHGTDKQSAAALGEGSLATASLSFFHGSAADAREELLDHEPWGDGEEAALRRIRARSQGRESLSAMRSPSAAAAGHSVTLGQTVLYDTTHPEGADGIQQGSPTLESKAGVVDAAPGTTGAKTTDEASDAAPASGSDHMADKSRAVDAANQELDERDAAISLHLFKTYLQKAAFWEHEAPRGHTSIDVSLFESALAPLLDQYPPVHTEEADSGSGKKSPRSKSKSDKGAVDIQLPQPAPHGVIGDKGAQHASRQVLADVVFRLSQVVQLPAASALSCDVPQFPVTMSLLGPPGSGVTTNCRFLAAAFNLHLIQPRALLSQALALADGRLALVDSTLPQHHAEALQLVGKHARDALRAGHAVPDVLVVQAIVTAVRALGGGGVEPTLAAQLPASEAQGLAEGSTQTVPEPCQGWIVDGFPGTTAQACLLEEALTWHIPQLAHGQQPAEIIPGQGQWTALRGAAFTPGSPMGSQGVALSTWEALVAGPREAHPVLDADADEQAAAATDVDDERCSSTVTPPSPRHPHGVKLVLRLGMSQQAALRRVLGVRVDGQRLVTIAAVDDEVPAGFDATKESKMGGLGNATVTGDGVYGHEVVDSTVKAGARGLQSAVASLQVGHGGLSVRVQSGREAESHEGGASAAVAPREPTASGVFVAAAQGAGSAVLSGSSVPHLPLSGGISAVDDVGPEGEAFEAQEHKHESSLLEDGVMQVAPTALLPVMPHGYVVRAKSGSVVYHLDSNPPAHKCKTVVHMSPPWAMPGGMRSQLQAGLAEGTPVLQPSQLALIMERYWSTESSVAAFYSAQGRGRYATVSAYKPCEGHEAAAAAACSVTDATGDVTLDSAAWEEYSPLGAWAAGCADSLNEAELFAVLKRVTSHFVKAINSEESQRSAAWEAVRSKRSAALEAHAKRSAAKLKQRRGEDAHEAVVSALEEAAAAAAAEVEATAEAKKHKGGAKGKDAAGEATASIKSGTGDEAREETPDAAAAESAVAEGPVDSTEPADSIVDEPADLNDPLTYVPPLPFSAQVDPSNDEHSLPAAKSPTGGVSFAASVTFCEGKEVESAAPQEEMDEATQLAAQAASIVVVPTRHVAAAGSKLPVPKALGALHDLWKHSVQHYGSTAQSALQSIALEQRGVHMRLGAVQRFLLHFLRRPVPQYAALMAHAQEQINAVSWEERMGPAPMQPTLSPAEAYLQQQVDAVLSAEAASSKKPAGKGDKNAPEEVEPTAEEAIQTAANQAAACRAQLAEAVELAACGMLAVTAARRDAALQYVDARRGDAWAAYVKSALAAHLCELLQVEADRLVGERMVLLGYFRALDGADGVGIWTGHNAAPSDDGPAADSLSAKSMKSTKEKKARPSKDADTDVMPDASADMLELQRLLEARALTRGGLEAQLVAAGAVHPALASGEEGDDRPGSSLKQKRSKSPKSSKDEEAAAGWPVSDANAPTVCALAPPVSPCVAIVPVAPPADVLPALKKVPAVQSVLPDGADSIWDPMREMATAAAESSPPHSARSGTPRSKSKQGQRGAADKGSHAGVLTLPLGWGEGGDAAADWDDIQASAADAMNTVHAVLQAAVHGVGVHVGMADELSQELLRVMDACCASAARAALATTAARHRAAQEAAVEEAVAAASDGKGKKGKGGKSAKKSKGGNSKDKKAKKGDEPASDPATAAVQWKASACPVHEDTGLSAVQDALAVCERVAGGVLQLVHAAAETQEIQRQRHAAEAVARERRRRRLLQEAASSAEAAAAEAAAEAEATAAAAAAAESLGSKKGAKANKPKDKSKDKARDKKGGKGGADEEESHLPAPDVTHATVDPAVWTAIVHRVQLFRSRCQYIGELATQLLATVDAAADRAWTASRSMVDAVLQQEVQAIAGFRATALRAVSTGARLPYRLCFTRPHADLDLDIMPAALSAGQGAQHGVGIAAAALAQGDSVVPSNLHVPALSGAMVGGLHEYQLPMASELGGLLPHPFPQSNESALEAALLPVGDHEGESKHADGETPSAFHLLSPETALALVHAPPCAPPDVPLQDKLQDFFKLHFQVDVTHRVLPPPTEDPRPALLLEDESEEAALRPRPSQLYAFALRLRQASMQSQFGGPYCARGYSVLKADLWPSPPPMVAEATQLTDGASEDGEEEEEAASSSLSSTKGGKGKDKSKDKSKGKDKAADEEAAVIAAAVRTAQAALLASEQALQGEELVPPGTFLSVDDFVQAVHAAIAAGELPPSWQSISDSSLAAMALCFVSDLAEWAPWEVRVEVEPSSSVAARKAYAAWQLQEVERLLAEESSAQARADSEEAERLGITAAEVADMRQAAELGEDVSQLLGNSQMSPKAGRPGSAGSRSGASTPRSATSNNSAVGGAADLQGGMALGSPLDVQQLTALQATSAPAASPKGKLAGEAKDEEGASHDSVLDQQQALNPEPASVEPVDVMQAEDASAMEGAVVSPPLAQAGGSATPDDTLHNFSRLCPGPASWPWQEPSTIAARRRVVLHHPLLHHQVPLRIAPQEWEGLVKKWGEAGVTKQASAQPMSSHHRDLAEALQAALAEAQHSAGPDSGVGGAGTAAVPVLSAGTVTPKGDFGQVAWPPVMQDLTTSGFVSSVQPVTVAGFGSLWIDFDASYTAATTAEKDSAGEQEDSKHEDSTAAFEVAAGNGSAPQLSLPPSASLQSVESVGAPVTPLAQRTDQAVQQGTADALRELYPPANFRRLVDWRGLVAWLSITGPSPASTAFLEAALSSVHGDSKEDATQGISMTVAAPVHSDGAAGSASGAGVLAALWQEGVQGGRDYAIQDITGFSTLVGKGWGVATWPRHEQLDELAMACERLAQQQLAEAESGHAAAAAPEGGPAEETGSAPQEQLQSSSSLAVDTAPASLPAAVPLREGQVFVIPPQLTPHGATPLQAEATEPEEEQGTPRSRKAKGKKGGKGGKKGGAADDEQPLVLQLHPKRQWVDPLAKLGPPGAVAEESLLPHAVQELPLWFESQGLHEKSSHDALADVAAAAAAQGSDFGAAAATAESQVDALIGIVSAQRTAANQETGGAVGWHHVSGDHSSREALLLADMTARAHALREMQEAETQRYTELADRDVVASVQHGDRIMRGVLLQALSDVYGRLDYGRLLRHWRRHVLLQEQLLREEAEEGMRGRRSRQSADTESQSASAGAAPQAAVRFAAAAVSEVEAAAVAAADAADAAMPYAEEALRRDLLMDVYAVLQRSAEEQRQAAADAAAQDKAAQEAALLMENEEEAPADGKDEDSKSADEATEQDSKE